jgi:hypothetical protein
MAMTISVRLSPGEWNDLVGEFRRGQTPRPLNDVGEKHSGDQFGYSTKIFISGCFALAAGKGEAFVKINPRLVYKSGHECFAPTKFIYEGYHPRSIHQKYHGIRGYINEVGLRGLSESQGF